MTKRGSELICLGVLLALAACGGEHAAGTFMSSDGAAVRGAEPSPTLKAAAPVSETASHPTNGAAGLRGSAAVTVAAHGGAGDNVLMSMQAGAGAGAGAHKNAAGAHAAGSGDDPSAVGGASGNAGVGGQPATAAEAVASAGCSKLTPRPASGAVTQNDHIYNFPETYDGKTPMPLLLALHAAGNPNTQLQKLTQGSRLETEFVRAFPKSAGSAWVYDTDNAKLSDVIDELLASYCIDTRRIFATGHSSGAQMVVQMLCKGEQRFKGVAPVAASKYCMKVSPIPVLYIQGQMDSQRGGGNGDDVVSVFTTSNACGPASTPIGGVPSCASTFDRMPVTPGCVAYDRCSVPTLWCSHNDNGYNSTDGHQHGWPCFASQAIADFFLSL